MDKLAYTAIQALLHCTFLPGSYEKRFVKSMAALGEGVELSPKQESFLKLVTWRYRRQIGSLGDLVEKVDMEWTRGFRSWAELADSRRRAEIAPRETER